MDQWKGTESPKINPQTCGQLSSIKEARLYNGEKASYAIGGGNAEQLHVNPDLFQEISSLQKNDS